MYTAMTVAGRLFIFRRRIYCYKYARLLLSVLGGRYQTLAPYMTSLFTLVLYLSGFGTWMKVGVNALFPDAKAPLLYNTLSSPSTALSRPVRTLSPLL